MFENTAFSLRERSGFEALDAGMLLYRRNFFKLQASWLTWYLPITAAVFLLPSYLLWIPPLAFWWFRPLWERLILRRAAHIFFGAAGKAAWKGVFRGILSDLSWRRFSPWRHYALPVRILEGIRGQRLRKRISFLHREFRGIAATLGIVMFLLETALLSGAVLFVVTMTDFMPHALRISLTWETPGALEAVITGWVLIAALTVPATVCMGFALYINRRVILEGWDLEIAFGRNASRRRGRLLSVLILVFLLTGPAARPAMAADPDIPLESLEQILADDDFGSESTRTAWRWKNRGSSDTNSPLDGVFGGGSETLAGMLRILMISAGVLAVGIIIWLNRDSLRMLLTGRRKPGKHSEEGRPAGFGDGEETPPLSQARLLFDDGRIRAAWSVLYRNQTAQLHPVLEDPPGREATEGEWMRRLESGDPARELIACWRQVAYAHRVPDDDVFHGELRRLTAGDGQE